MAKSVQYWLMKSEPDVYSIHNLVKDKTTHWDGVRNYQARNFMRDKMRIGDRVLFYHSNAKPPGVAGTAIVCKESYPDFSAFDKKSKYFDAKSDKADPRWFMVDIKIDEVFADLVTLPEIKEVASLKDMVLLNNPRLSVQPVKKKEFETILKMAGKKA